MTAIPVHTSTPIHASTGVVATAITPVTLTGEQTPGDVLEPNSAASLPASNPAMTTGTPLVAPIPARPQAAPMPAPTSTTTPSRTPTMTPTQTTPLSPSQTEDSPPAPQPGAFPSPTPPTSNMTRKLSVPPPPKQGEEVKPPSFYAPQSHHTRAPSMPAAYYPPNPTHQRFASVSHVSTAQRTPAPFSSHQRFSSVSYTPPTQRSPPPLPTHQRFASVSHMPTRAQPIASTTRVDLSNPPGYVQNANTAFDDKDPLPEEEKPVFLNSFGLGTPTRTGSFLDSGYEDTAKGIWDTAKEWAMTAGRKLSIGEQEVWKVLGQK